jgi:hypothetical protein
MGAQMANFPDIRTVVIDRKDGPLEVGLHGYDALNNFFAGVLIEARGPINVHNE